jgi:hypothetical protein
MEEKDAFFDLAFNPANTRGDEIIEEMNNRLKANPEMTNGEWLRSCFIELANNQAEELFIAFAAGTIQNEIGEQLN